MAADFNAVRVRPGLGKTVLHVASVPVEEADRRGDQQVMGRVPDYLEGMKIDPRTRSGPWCSTRIRPPAYAPGRKPGGFVEQTVSDQFIRSRSVWTSMQGHQAGVRADSGRPGGP
jgi:hypothetical protein